MKLGAKQRETAIKIKDDAQRIMSSHGTGSYASTIQVGDTIKEGNRIYTEVYTDFKVQAKSNGNIYLLGELLEYGTNMHAIPNAFGWGNFYGYFDLNGRWHKGTLDKDWHPGSISVPHFLPALNANKSLYRQKIKEALEESIK